MKAMVNVDLLFVNYNIIRLRPFKMLTSNNKKQKSSLLAAGFFFKGHIDARLKRVFSHREDRYLFLL